MIDPAVFTQLTGVHLVVSAKSNSAAFWHGLSGYGIKWDTQHRLHAAAAITPEQAVADLEAFISDNPDPEMGLLVFGTCKGITSPIVKALAASGLIDRVWHYNYGFTTDLVSNRVDIVGDAVVPYRQSSIRLAKPLAFVSTEPEVSVGMRGGLL